MKGIKNKRIVLVVCTVCLLLFQCFNNISYARNNYEYCQGFKIKKTYNKNMEEVYWIIGLLENNTPELNFPSIQPQNKLPIVYIYDATTSRGVFQGNPWIEKVDFSNSQIELIGNSCFENCTKLKQYTGISTLKEILASAFKKANLNGITLNDGLERIRDNAFEDAFSDENSLYIIDIPDSVTLIGKDAFKVTDKHYRVILLGNKDSVAEQYCKENPECRFVVRGDAIPTEEQLEQEEFEREMQKLFINPEFKYQNYNNTNNADATILFGTSASSFERSNWEYFGDIIAIDDGFIVVGRSCLYMYDFESSNYYKEMIGSQVKGSDDAIIAKYNKNLGLEWVKSFGGSFSDGFSDIYKTLDGGYVAKGWTNSIDKDLYGINDDSNVNHDVWVKYDSNFNIKDIILQKEPEDLEAEIIKRNYWEVSDGEIHMSKVSDGVDDLESGADGYETNALIEKYDINRKLEWSKLYDRNSSHTDDCLMSVAEADDCYVFVGSTSQQKLNSRKEPIYVQDAFIVKYNKPYDQIIINGMLQFNMYIGQQETPDLWYIPWEDVKLGEIEWTSEDESVATVDYSGKITAVGEGRTNVTVNVRGKTRSVLVNVTDPSLVHINSIKLDKQDLNLKVGDHENLFAEIIPADTTDSKTIIWSSSDSNVVTVNDNGEIIALNEGQATVTAQTCNGKTAGCLITVTAYELGDVNADGKINVIDCTAILKHIKGTKLLTDDEKTRADVSKDNKVNVIDCTAILKHIKGTKLIEY